MNIEKVVEFKNFLNEIKSSKGIEKINVSKVDLDLLKYIGANGRTFASMLAEFDPTWVTNDNGILLLQDKDSGRTVANHLLLQNKSFIAPKELLTFKIKNPKVYDVNERKYIKLNSTLTVSELYILDFISKDYFVSNDTSYFREANYRAIETGFVVSYHNKKYRNITRFLSTLVKSHEYEKLDYRRMLSIIAHRFDTKGTSIAKVITENIDKLEKDELHFKKFLRNCLSLYPDITNDYIRYNQDVENLFSKFLKLELVS